MNFGRKAAAWFLSAILVLMLWSTALDIGLIRIFGSPKPVETTLSDSGVYSSIVPGLLSEAKSVDSAGGSIPLSDPIVKSAAIASLTPQFLQTNTNQALEAIYQWLDGKTAQPSFVINLTAIKTNFADKVAAGAEQKAAALPVCTAPPTSPSVDVFSVTCLPKGVTPQQVADQVHSTIINGHGFLDNPVITADSIKAGSCPQITNASNVSCPGKPVFSNQLKSLPDKYRAIKKTPFALAAICLIFTGLILLVYEPKRKGWFHLGFLFAGTGFLVMLFAMALKEAVSNKVLSKIDLNSAVLQSSLRNIVRDAVHSLSNAYLLIGLFYVILGLIGVGVGYYLKRRAGDTEEKPPAEPAPTPAKPKAEATDKPKPPVKKVKIQ